MKKNNPYSKGNLTWNSHIRWGASFDSSWFLNHLSCQGQNLCWPGLAFIIDLRVVYLLPFWTLENVLTPKPCEIKVTTLQMQALKVWWNHLLLQDWQEVDASSKVLGLKWVHRCQELQRAWWLVSPPIDLRLHFLNSNEVYAKFS